MLDPALKSAKEAQAALEKSHVAGTQPSLELPTYLGTYADSMYGDIVIAERNGALAMALGQFKGTLSHWNYDTFRAQMDNPSAGRPLVTFVLGASGKPTELKVQGFEDATFRNVPAAADTTPGLSLTTTQLQALVGRYRPEPVQLDIDVQLIGDALKLTVPGQPTYTLVAESPTRFRMIGPPEMPDGFVVEFEMSGATATGATIIQPAPRPSMKLKKQ
jgi:hypothetical protein